MQTGRLWVLVFFVLVNAAGLLAAECTIDDYKASYTECSNDNIRDLVYYKKHGANCTGGFGGNETKYDLPCGISCSAGTYLPLGELYCEVCSPGSFSTGGGDRIDSWYYQPEHFVSYSTSSNGTRFETLGWTTQNTYMRSGNITDSMTSVLEYSVYIASAKEGGHVTFTYRVNAEGPTSGYSPLNLYDGIKFVVDGHVIMQKISHTHNFVTVTYPLDFGAHVLQWIYTKDSTLTRGEDAAFISMIEIDGENYANDFCTLCSEGTYSSLSNSTRCQPCPANSFADSLGSVQCSPCPSDSYSFSEARSCSPRLPCTEDDYERFFSPCDSTGKRSLSYSYITPIICDYAHFALPATQQGLPCGDCTDGAFRDPTTHTCEYCPDGQFSVGGHPCQACPSGTAAVKTFAVTHFDDWVEGYATNCSGDCLNQGWVLHSTYMDSGIGHGSTVDSWFAFTTNLTAPGTVTFEFEIKCPSTECSLSFNKGETYSGARTNQTTTVSLPKGVHSLNWTFSKYDYTSTHREDAARIYNIVISSANIGGAKACSPCANGTISAPGATHCSACPAGQQSNADKTKCVDCPAGTHNSVAGGTCIPCGAGTSPLADHTSCEITCTFSPDGIQVFDLNALKSDKSYGPIVDSKKQDYYINICSMQPQMCYSDINTTIESYACQETTGKIPNSQIPLGKDLGHVLGWKTLPNNSYDNNLGVMMTLEYGDVGCGKNRDTKIAFVCDPMAGKGEPRPDGVVESPPCSYNFVWHSLYACPVCRPDYDMDFYYSSCQNGQRLKTYYWRQNPHMCHDGPELPEPTVVNCTETSTRCPAGQYLQDEGDCTPCKAGSFSVGGGERITSWAVMPTRFSSSCSPADSCTSWSGDEDGVGTISSGTGTSRLAASYNFVVAGNISFSYKAYLPNTGKFAFNVDTVEQLHVPQSGSKLDWVEVVIPVSKGIHFFEWVFTAGTEASKTVSRVGAVLKDVTVTGVDYHDEACTPCPPGFVSAVGASICTPCSVGYYSHADASECLACPANTGSLSKASQCETLPLCTAANVVAVYSECFANSTRALSYEYLQPKLCAPSSALPATQLVPCDQTCPPGTFSYSTTPGKCSACSSGQYFDGDSCVTPAAGSAVVKHKYYFADNKTASLPSAFTTVCSGDCGSNGWRIKNSGIDSGYHGANAADSQLTLKTTVSGRLGGITFDYSITELTQENSLTLYLDGVFVVALFGTNQYTLKLKEGTHNITWNYHQHQHNTGYAELSNVVVAGATDSDAGASLEICPAGTYSNAASPDCTYCPPGSFSSKAGSEICEMCPENKYNSMYGATECLKCEAGTTAAAGAEYCTTDCSFAAEIAGSTFTYSLQGHDVVGPLRAMNSTFYFNFCNSSLYETPCNPGRATHSCATEDIGGAARDWGGFLDYNYARTAAVDSKNTTFSISFAYGDQDGCEPGVRRSTVFNFQCDKYASEPVLNAEQSSQCTAVFDWAGEVGCTVCQDSDYDTMLGECKDGMRTVQKVRKTICNGENVKTLTAQSCSGTVEFPIVVVFVIIGVILVLVAVAVIVFIKNRRITAQYSRLKHGNQSDGHTVLNEDL